MLELGELLVRLLNRLLLGLFGGGRDGILLVHRCDHRLEFVTILGACGGLLGLVSLREPAEGINQPPCASAQKSRGPAGMSAHSALTLVLSPKAVAILEFLCPARAGEVFG